MKSPVGNTLQAATQAHDSGDWFQAARLYNAILEQDPANVNTLHQFGMLCHQVGQYGDALDLIDRAIMYAEGDDPRSIRLRADLAESLLAEGRPEEALAECELARDLAAGKGDAKLFLLQAKAFEQLGDANQAVACIQEAIEQAPDHAGAHLELAKLLDRQGRLEEAAGQYERVLELQPKNAESVLQLTRLMLRGDVPIGDPWVNRIRSTLPFADDDRIRIELRFALAQVHDHRHEAAQADAAYRQANLDQAQRLK